MRYLILAMLLLPVPSYGWGPVAMMGGSSRNWSSTTPGTYSFTVPAGVSSLSVIMLGPGGGGGGGGGTNGVAGGGGGGGVTGTSSATGGTGGTGGTATEIKRGASSLAAAAVGAGGNGGFGWNGAWLPYGAGGAKGTSSYPSLTSPTLTTGGGSSGGAGGAFWGEGVTPSHGSAGGAGDKITGTLAVTPGETITVVVGAGGQGGAGGGETGQQGSAGAVTLNHGSAQTVAWTTKPPPGTALRTDGHWSVTGLVGAWPLNEGSGTTAYDATGNANGTVSGTATLTASGLVCDGSADSELKIANAAGLKPTSALTFVVGMTTSSTPATYAKAISHNTGYYLEPRSAGNISVGIGSTVQITPTITVGVPAIIAGVYDGSNVISYKDGAYQGQTAKTGNISGYNASYGLSVGGRNTDTSQNFPATYNFVLVYNRALSAAEIASLSANPWQIFQ